MSLWCNLKKALLYGAIYEMLFGKKNSHSMAEDLFLISALSETKHKGNLSTKNPYIRSDKTLYDYHSVDELEEELYELESQLDGLDEDSESYELLQDRIDMLQDRIDELEDLDDDDW